MPHRCRPRPPAGADRPLVAGPDEAARLIRLAVDPPAGPALALLLCDAGHGLVLALAIDGATAGAVGRAVDLVAGVARPGGVEGVVVGIVRPRGTRLDPAQAAGLSGVADRCSAAGVALLDLLVVGPRQWRSVRALAGAGGAREDGWP